MCGFQGKDQLKTDTLWTRLQKKLTATEVVKEIRRRARRVFSAEEKIVLEGLRSDDSIANICLKPAFTQTLTSSGAKTFWRLARE